MKLTKWLGNLNLTRPIILIETSRKLYIFMMTKCLSYLLTLKKVLTGMNWASLPDGQTIFSIITMKNLIEDALNQNKTLWILLQDIKHTFDSVSPQFLIKVLLKPKIPSLFVNIIDNLVQNWTTWIDTYYRSIKEIDLERGLDQDDSILPLLRILFYELLLQKINQKTVSYLMSASVNSDLRYIFENWNQRDGFYRWFHMDFSIQRRHGIENRNHRKFFCPHPNRN